LYSSLNLMRQFKCKTDRKMYVMSASAKIWNDCAPAFMYADVGKCTRGGANLISRNALSACLVTFEEANRDRVLSEWAHKSSREPPCAWVYLGKKRVSHTRTRTRLFPVLFLWLLRRALNASARLDAAAAPERQSLICIPGGGPFRKSAAATRVECTFVFENRIKTNAWMVCALAWTNFF